MEAELEAQRVRAMQADRLHALGEMAAGVAHELNQPLTAIATTAEGFVLRQQAGLEIPGPRTAEMMVDVLALTERMSNIINHMRVFARETSEEAPTSFSISEVVQNMLRFVEMQLKVHGITIRLDIPEELPQCKGWPNEIEQVLFNLVSNARDVLDERQEKIKTEESPSDPQWEPVVGIQVEWTEKEDDLKIHISDTGGGIDEAVFSRIFDPFYTTKEVGSGTGLGLSISKGIVEKHDGRLEVENRIDEGVTFSVILPVEHDVK
jgi:histidine kinase